MRVEQTDQSPSRVASSADEGDLGRLRVGGVVLAQRRVRICCRSRRRRRGDGAVGPGARYPLGSPHQRADSSACRKCPRLLDVAGADRRTRSPPDSVSERRLDVVPTQYRPAVFGEVGYQFLHLVGAADAVPEENVAVTGQAPVGLVEEPRQVLVVLFDCPDEFGMVLPDAGQHVVGHVGQPSRLRDREGVKVCERGRSCFCRRRDDDRQSFHRLVRVSLKGLASQAVEISIDGGASVEAFAVADEHAPEPLEILKLGHRPPDADLVTAPDQGPRAGVGEELLLQVGRVDDRNARGSRQVHEQLSDLLDLQPGPVADPPLRHQVIVLLVEVDGRDLLVGVGVVEAALLGEEDDLQRLQRSRQLTGCDVGVDVQDLALPGLGHGRQDRKASGLDRGFDRPLVHLGDLSHQVVLGLVQIVGRKDAGSDRSRANAEVLELLHQLQILLEEQRSRQRQRLSVRDANTVLELRFNTCRLQ